MNCATLAGLTAAVCILAPNASMAQEVVTEKWTACAQFPEYPPKVGATGKIYIRDWRDLKSDSDIARLLDKALQEGMRRCPTGDYVQVFIYEHQNEQNYIVAARRERGAAQWKMTSNLARFAREAEQRAAAERQRKQREQQRAARRQELERRTREILEQQPASSVNVDRRDIEKAMRAAMPASAACQRADGVSVCAFKFPASGLNAISGNEYSIVAGCCDLLLTGDTNILTVVLPSSAIDVPIEMEKGLIELFGKFRFAEEMKTCLLSDRPSQKQESQKDQIAFNCFANRATIYRSTTTRF